MKITTADVAEIPKSQRNRRSKYEAVVSEMLKIEDGQALKLSETTGAQMQTVTMLVKRRGINCYMRSGKGAFYLIKGDRPKAIDEASTKAEAPKADAKAVAKPGKSQRR